eukprot:TRINITY_DN4226_c0_g1_i1.p1 TRINITY_DN4226_c0_g1~~TRINITY_DN4226_c0_g1_i1.p1  ORF type:complete len:200 (-),score=24.18 TRINITY_DN4226_c0_g1_i1:325-924(-)
MGSKGSKKKDTGVSVAPSAAKTAKVKPDLDYKFKVLMIGDSGVGKSCLLLRATDNTFTESFIGSIGSEFKELKLEVLDKIVVLQIWDTAGQERFRTVTSSYYQGSDAILCCYDITNLETFNNLQKWMGEVDRYARDNQFKAIVGCKSDLEQNRAVREEEAVEFSDQLNLMHFTTSSKDATGVDYLFNQLAQELVRKAEE